MGSEKLARWRVPLSWACGLAALYVASPTPRLYAAGLSVAALGEVLRLWAAGHLEKNTKLATSGPYAWTRNPLYLGSLLVGVGFALATGRFALLVVVVALFAAVYAPVMRREATRLAEAFPDVYPAYAERVPLFWPSPAGSGEGGFSLARIVRNREYWTVLGWLAVALLLGWKLL